MMRCMIGVRGKGKGGTRGEEVSAPISPPLPRLFLPSVLLLLPRNGTAAFSQAAWRGSIVSSPRVHPQGHNSPVCSASSTRSTSSGARPTPSSVT